MTAKYTYRIDEANNELRIYYPDGTELSNSPMVVETNSYKEPQVLVPCLFSEFVDEINREYSKSSDIVINETAISLLTAVAYPQEYTEVKPQ